METSNLQVIQVPTDKLKFAPYNPRTLSTKDFEALQHSIDQFGFIEPVIVNKRSGLIVGGHQRVRAATSLGYTELPVVYVDLDDKKERALNVALNKISGTWDDQLLQELLLGLDEEDLLLTGFDDEELLKLQDGWAAEEADKLLDEPKDKTKRFSVDELEQLRQVYESKGGNPDTASFLQELKVVSG